MRTTAIICAAGNGERAGFSKNKTLVPLRGAPILWHTLEKFAFADEIIITFSEDDREEFEKIAEKFAARLSPGGETRTESVYKALKIATGDIVLIHDGARPYVTKKEIDACLESVKTFGSGVCAVPAVNTVAVTRGGRVYSVPERKTVYEILTPQGFYTTDIMTAYEKAMDDDCAYTDDSSIFAKYIEAPKICEGSPENVKLTYPEDFVREERALFKTCENVGFGEDAHVLAKGNHVRLLGVDIPANFCLTSHTDGDCAAHAVADALLSAARLNDIGFYFPDTDEKLRGADSMKILRGCLEKVRESDFAVTGVTVLIEAEEPRLSPYIEAMKKNLSEVLGVGEGNIAVHAGTAEGIGFVGSKTGITAYSAVSLTKIK